MKKTKKKKKIKSINLAYYFGLLILVIIMVSVLFKSIDVVRKSKFDSNNRFTVAILNNKNVDLITVSPNNKKQTNIRVENADSFDSIDDFSIPVDVYIKTDSNFSPESKLIFLKILLNKVRLESSLNILDLLKLSIYSIGIDKDNFSYEKVKLEDKESLSRLSSTEFVDETISSEKVSIHVTNSTQVGGLADRIAKIITNLGGNVVLVNSSKDPKQKSVIYYKKESYTIKKISEILHIETQKKDLESISDVVIVIGNDKEEF